MSPQHFWSRAFTGSPKDAREGLGELQVNFGITHGRRRKARAQLSKIENLPGEFYGSLKERLSRSLANQNGAIQTAWGAATASEHVVRAAEKSKDALAHWELNEDA